MRSSKLTLPALLVLAGTACPPPAPPPPGFSDADRQAITQASDAAIAGLNSRDWAGAAAVYTDDAALMPPNAPAVEGRDAIPGFLAAFPPFSDLKVSRLAIHGRRDLAFVHGKYTMTVMGMPDSGKYLEIWKQGADGSWKIYRDMFSSDIPLPSPEPVRR